jgi:hypothetical protein
MKYKISLRNHLKALEFSLFVVLVIIGFQIYQSHMGYDYINWGIVGWAIVSFLPVLYLHIEYYYYNRGTEFEIDAYEKKFTYTNKRGTTETYSFDDLSKIIVNMSPNMHRGSGFQILPFEQYHYAKIYTKSGKEIIITCLMARKVMDLVGSIRGVPVEKKKRIFASILMG